MWRYQSGNLAICQEAESGTLLPFSSAATRPGIFRGLKDVVEVFRRQAAQQGTGLVSEPDQRGGVWRSRACG